MLRSKISSQLPPAVDLLRGTTCSRVSIRPGWNGRVLLWIRRQQMPSVRRPARDSTLRAELTRPRCRSSPWRSQPTVRLPDNRLWSRCLGSPLTASTRRMRLTVARLLVLGMRSGTLQALKADARGGAVGFSASANAAPTGDTQEPALRANRQPAPLPKSFGVLTGIPQFGIFMTSPEDHSFMFRQAICESAQLLQCPFMPQRPKQIDSPTGDCKGEREACRGEDVDSHVQSLGEIQGRFR